MQQFFLNILRLSTELCPKHLHICPFELPYLLTAIEKRWICYQLLSLTTCNLSVYMKKIFEIEKSIMVGFLFYLRRLSFFMIKSIDVIYIHTSNLIWTNVCRNFQSGNEIFHCTNAPKWNTGTFKQNWIEDGFNAIYMTSNLIYIHLESTLDLSISQGTFLWAEQQR